jgi:hypothetical protein
MFSPDSRFPITRMLPKAGPGAVLWREAQRELPAGVADIDSDTVVARLAISPYEVLPSYAGLAQLLDDGALEVLNSRRVRRFGNLTVIGEANVQGLQAPEEYALPSDFRIVKKTRLPPALQPGFRFVLAKGVPMPDGSVGGSAIVPEETAEDLR